MPAVYLRGRSFNIAQSLLQVSNHLFTLFTPYSGSMERVQQGVDFIVRTLPPRFKALPHRLLLSIHSGHTFRGLLLNHVLMLMCICLSVPQAPRQFEHLSLQVGDSVGRGSGRHRRATARSSGS